MTRWILLLIFISAAGMQTVAASAGGEIVEGHLPKHLVRFRTKPKDSPYLTAFFASGSSARRRVARMATPAIKDAIPRIPGTGYVSYSSSIVENWGGPVTTCFGVI
jgi:hypothetical protein